MRSNVSAERLSLERGLPTTIADVAALRRVRAGRPMDTVAYLKFLSSLGPPPAGVLRARQGPAGDPFVLR